MTDTKKRLPLEDGTAMFRSQELHKAAFWCSSSGSPHHWITSYEFTNGITAGNTSYQGVSLDMFQPGAHQYQRPDEAPNLYGTLKFSARPKNKIVSRNPGFMITLAFTRKITVQELYDLIVTNGLHLYKYNPSGSGCMYWQVTLLKKFVARGWLEQAELIKVMEALQIYARKKGNFMVPYPPVEGKFYKARCD